MKIASRIVAWQRAHGRHDLPWQQTRDPYRVWLSEIMLQQTQVTAVIPYYLRFLDRFPDVAALAQAPAQEVMALWAGLGYYARARNLHACAKTIMEKWGGKFPTHAQGLATLPGIGPSTAAAIAAFCYAERAAILDGNVKRVLSRFFAIEGDITTKAIEQRLWQLASQELPTAAQLKRDPDIMSSYTQALMDMGATLCTRSQPSCKTCPIQKGCEAYRLGRTLELPWPKARKRIPERCTGMLIACHQGKVLLEKRPDSGIWGGLWSLPEVAGQTPAEDYCKPFGLIAKRAQCLPAFQHTFTHFRLTIESVLAHVNPSHGTMHQHGALEWVSIDKLKTLGMPTPVRKMIDGLLAEDLLG